MRNTHGSCHFPNVFGVVGLSPSVAPWRYWILADHPEVDPFSTRDLSPLENPVVPHTPETHHPALAHSQSASSHCQAVAVVHLADFNGLLSMWCHIVLKLLLLLVLIAVVKNESPHLSAWNFRAPEPDLTYFNAFVHGSVSSIIHCSIF